MEEQLLKMIKQTFPAESSEEDDEPLPISKYKMPSKQNFLEEAEKKLYDKIES